MGSERTPPDDPWAVRALRERLMLSQRDLADALGVTPLSVANWEYGRSAPRAQSLRAMERLQRRWEAAQQMEVVNGQ